MEEGDVSSTYGYEEYGAYRRKKEDPLSHFVTAPPLWGAGLTRQEVKSVPKVIEAES